MPGSSASNGEVWLNGGSNKLQYKVNNEVRTAVPLSKYFTTDATIVRGSLVSINNTGDNIAVKTNNSTAKKSLGIVSDIEGSGSPWTLTVQAINKLRIYNPNTLFDAALQDSDVGSLFYAGTTAGTYTLNINSASLGNRNLITVGHIVNTQLAASPTPYIEVEISLEGDGRGPIDQTQFEYYTGEPVRFSVANRFTIPKVFALGSSAAGEIASLLITFNDDLNISAMYNAVTAIYMVVYSSDYCRVIVFNNSDTAVADFSSNSRYSAARAAVAVAGFSLTDPNLSIVPLNASATYVDMIDTSGSNLTAVTTGHTVNTFASKLAAASIFAGGITFEAQTTIGFTTFSDQARVGHNLYTINIEASAAAGSLGMFTNASLSVSTSFLRETEDLNFSTRVGNPGQYINTAKAILANCSDIDRARIVGVSIPYPTAELSAVVIPANTKMLFQKIGSVGNFNGTLTAGNTYYTYLNGQITDQTALVDNSGVLFTSIIGMARDINTLDVAQSHCESLLPKDSLPVGAVDMLPVGVTTANYGYLLCNGATINKSTNPEYTDLVNILNAVVGTSTVSIALPNLNAGTQKYQIKYENYDGYPRLSPVSRFTFTNVYSDFYYSASWHSVPNTVNTLVGGTYQLNPNDPPRLYNCQTSIFITSGGITREVLPGVADAVSKGFSLQEDSYTSTSFTFSIIPGTSGFGYYYYNSGNISYANLANGDVVTIIVMLPESFGYYRDKSIIEAELAYIRNNASNKAIQYAFIFN